MADATPKVAEDAEVHIKVGPTACVGSDVDVLYVSASTPLGGGP